MSTIVIGIGNPVLSDDSVGIKVADTLACAVGARRGLEIRTLWHGGLRLMEAMNGHERAIIIDAVVTEGGKPGTVYKVHPAELRQSRNSCSVHDGSFQEALALGAMLGMKLPSQIDIWVVEAADVATFSENLSADVQRAVPEVVERVMQQLTGSRRARPVTAGVPRISGRETEASSRLYPRGVPK